MGKGEINFSNGVPLSLSTTCKDRPHAWSNWSTHNELSPFFSCDFVKDKEHKVGGQEALWGIRIGEVQSNYIV